MISRYHRFIMMINIGNFYFHIVRSGRVAKKRRRVASLAQRRAANIRERRRMFNLNEAFDRLRNKVSITFFCLRYSKILYFCYIHTNLYVLLFIIFLQVPTFAYEKRLSRIETLRLAITYISFMGDLLTSGGGNSDENSIAQDATSSITAIGSRNGGLKGKDSKQSFFSVPNKN